MNMSKVQEMVEKLQNFGLEITNINLDVKPQNGKLMLARDEMRITFILEHEKGFGSNLADELSQDYGKANAAVCKSLYDKSSVFSAVIKDKDVSVNANELMFVLERNTLKVKTWDHSKTMKIVNDVQFKMAMKIKEML